MTLLNGLEDGGSHESIHDRTVINLLLVDLGSPHNLGAIMRTCRSLGGVDVGLFIYDPRDILTRYAEDVRRSSLDLSIKPGAFPRVVNNQQFLETYPGRIIATEISTDAVVLTEFTFQRHDLILVGNENRGYHTQQLTLQPGIDHVQSRIIVPMLGTPYEVPSKWECRTGTYRSVY